VGSAAMVIGISFFVVHAWRRWAEASMKLDQILTTLLHLQNATLARLAQSGETTSPESVRSFLGLALDFELL